jgi:hypothetical protein
MSTPNHWRHFGALGATASGIKVSSGGRELLVLDAPKTPSLDASCQSISVSIKDRSLNLTLHPTPLQNKGTEVRMTIADGYRSMKGEIVSYSSGQRVVNPLTLTKK